MATYADPKDFGYIVVGEGTVEAGFDDISIRSQSVACVSGVDQALRCLRVESIHSDVATMITFWESECRVSKKVI